MKQITFHTLRLLFISLQGKEQIQQSGRIFAIFLRVNRMGFGICSQGGGGERVVEGGGGGDGAKLAHLR